MAKIQTKCLQTEGSHQSTLNREAARKALSEGHSGIRTLSVKYGYPKHKTIKVVA